MNVEQIGKALAALASVKVPKELEPMRQRILERLERLALGLDGMVSSARAALELLTMAVDEKAKDVVRAALDELKGLEDQALPQPQGALPAPLTTLELAGIQGFPLPPAQQAPPPAPPVIKPQAPAQKPRALLQLAEELGTEPEGEKVLLAVRLLKKEKQRLEQCIQGVENTASVIGRGAALVELPAVPHRGKVLKWKERTSVGMVQAGEWCAFSGPMAKRLGIENLATAKGQDHLMEAAKTMISEAFGRNAALDDLAELVDDEEQEG
jgi:hypothetical protein